MQSPLATRRRLLAAFSLAAVGTACAPIAQYAQPKIKLPEPSTHDGLLVRVDGLLFLGYGVAGVRGVVENTTWNTFRSVSLNFDLLNAEGIKVGYAMAATNGLAHIQKWAFQAMILAPSAVQFSEVSKPRVQVF